MINGALMSRDTEVAKIKDGAIDVLNEGLLPLYFKKYSNFESWLESRAIDRHRTNSRLLKKALRLGNYEDAALVLKVNAATITDTYWFRGEDELNLSYKDIVYKENIFDKLALYGDFNGFELNYSRTPELTNIGSYEKCWRRIDNHWWMYKQGNDLERFSEMFAFKLGKRLGFAMAKYELDGEYIRSLDFTDGARVNFESTEGLVGDNDDYILNFDIFNSLSESLAKQYIAIIYLDTLVMNVDRHTKNYGILRDPLTGRILSLAPNFDNNIALFSRGYPEKTERNDLLVRLFLDLLKKREKAFLYFKELICPEITKELILSCCDEIPIEVNRKLLYEFIINAELKIKLNQ